MVQPEGFKPTWKPLRRRLPYSVEPRLHKFDRRLDLNPSPEVTSFYLTKATFHPEGHFRQSLHLSKMVGMAGNAPAFSSHPKRVGSLFPYTPKRHPLRNAAKTPKTYCNFRARKVSWGRWSELGDLNPCYSSSQTKCHTKLGEVPIKLVPYQGYAPRLGGSKPLLLLLQQ